MQDPARYNVTANDRLFSENITFARRQVGQLWWDLSSTRYVYYEQPIALNGSESETDNLVYRRDHWGQLFPGSTVDIYEWVESDVIPAEYEGSGTPRDTTSYVQVDFSNRFTNITETKYYFWVQNTTDLPNVENRTMAALSVSSLLQAPKSQGFVFFSPIQQTQVNNSYMFYNVQEILAYQGDNIQIQYRLAEREDQEHTQWSFFREGDPNSIVTDQYWNKMVDSLCGYTKPLPVSDEYNGIPVGPRYPWEIFPWDSTPWDMTITGEVLPVPDPTLSEKEKFGIEYRPRQGMFVRLADARKVFVQAANALLQHIAVRDDNPGWDVGVESDMYWKYTNWYKFGYEGTVPSIVFSTLADAIIALSANQLAAGTILQVTNGTVDGRFVLYEVVQINPSITTLSLEEVCVENSAIMLLDTIYTVSNVFGLSTELRELLNAFRTQVMVDEFKVDQNELFFAMLNYVVSEQKNPDWLFKSSYIYVKENNLPLSQDQLYIPNQIENVIDYITDVKPYHTQIRDYTSTYVTSDLAEGTAYDSYKISSILTFGPDNTDYTEPGHWDANCGDNAESHPWDSYAWDVCPPRTYILNAQTFLDNIEQFVSREDVFKVELTFFDPSKVGYSQLFPYTFDFDGINLNNPQSFITPYDIVGIQIGTLVLIYGQDYYVEYNDIDETYTVYFYNDPSVYLPDVPQALVWFNGGGMQHFRYNTVRNEVAHGFSRDNLVVNVDTKLPVNDVSAEVLGTEPATFVAPYAPLLGWGDSWDGFIDPAVEQIISDAGGTTLVPWDVPFVPVLFDNTISFKENTDRNISSHFYRNAQRTRGELLVDLPSPTADTEYLDIITVFVNPLTNPTTDILPTPDGNPGVIWIEGERIEYRMKVEIAPNTWELKLVRRGTMGTSSTEHAAMIPSLDDPLVFVPNPVWVERSNHMPVDSNNVVWNVLSLPSAPDVVTEGPPGEFTSVENAAAGGLWYAQTPQSIFLKQAQGRGIP